MVDPAEPVNTHRPSSEEGLLRAAFRELHGPRLHGFALLVTLGDSHEAGRLASEALADGARSANALRHPDRAAAWLRAHVVRNLRRRRRGSRIDEQERRAALAPLGVDGPTYDALASLDPALRVGLVAGWIEALDARDLEAVLRRQPPSLARLLARSRRRFLDAYVRAAPAADIPPYGPVSTGPLALQVRAVADRTLAPGGGGA